MKRIFSFFIVVIAVGFHLIAMADTWNGSASEWTHGSGTSSDPYLIESAANLAWLQEMVNGGVSTYSGAYFRMTTDINLNGRSWVGIGTSEEVCFQGNFNGNGYSINGINTALALFSYVKNTTISNLSTYGSAGQSGIVGYSYGTSSIEYCSSNVNVNCTSTSYAYAGGILGANMPSGKVTIISCHNTGPISSTNKAGGIIGLSSNMSGSQAIITNTYNTGSVTVSSDHSAGGIIGESGKASIINCYNSGNVSSSGSGSVGGILGYTYLGNITLQKSYNVGRVSGLYCGGIVGTVSNASGNITNCYNTGSIGLSRGYYSGGIVGRFSSSGSLSVKNCYNIGYLYGNGTNYGIAETCSNSYYLESCGSTSGCGTSKSAAIMRSNSMPILLDSTVFTVDREPYFNNGYPIFNSSIYMVTKNTTNVGFRTATLNGAYYLGGVEPGVQGFFYKKSSSDSFDTVYANIGSPFEYNLIDLTPGITYKYLAFAIKNNVIYKGDTLTFTTISCTSTLTATINASATSICEGDTATFTAVGSSAYSDNFTYSWNNGQNTATIYATRNHTYRVTVTDDNGCTANKSVTLTVNPLPEGAISGRTSICSGNSTTLTASGANSYTWSTGATTPTLTTSSAGTYTCTFRNSYGCTSTQDVTVSVFEAPTISGTTAICSGNSTTLTASGADSYIWSNDATTSAITVSEGGTYTVTGTTSDGCSGSAGVTVSVGSLPTIAISGNPSFCQGGNTVLTATGGTSYEWANGTTDDTITVTTPGIYVVTGTNADGCSNTASIEVAMRPSYINMPVSATICQGSTYNAMGTNYSTAGAYHVEGTTVAGCDSIIDLTLTVNPLPTPSITGNTSICQGTSTTLAALGGTSFLWNNGSTSQAISVSNAGVYSVTVTDANGCSNSTTATVSVNPLPTVTIAGNTAICAGDSTTLTASGADSYQWSNGAIGASITVTNGGTYTVTGTSANGCQNIAAATVTVNPTYNGVPVSQAICEGSSYNFFGTMLNEAGTYTQNGITTAGCDSVVNLTLTVNPLPTATISGNTTFCEGSNTTLTATGGATYLWNDGTTTSSVTVANGGAYSVTVTDANGCSNTASAVVTANPLPNITISGNTAFCEGSSTVLTAQGGNSYTWSNGAQTAYITVTSSGNYTVTGVGSNGCSNTASVSVSATPLPTITINGNTSFCQGGSTTLTATGADSYTWNNGTTTPSITVDAFGIYSVVGSTAIGCTGTASVTVTVSPNPTITISGDTELCPDETTTLTANGGTSYMWFDGTTSATYQTSTAGSYSVIGYNDAGCHTMATAEVEAYPDAESEETATATGSYTWNGETYTESGDYTFVTTTAHGCDSTVTLHLTIEEGGNDGIDDISADDIKVYVNGRNIVIEGSLDESVMVYDVMGRTIYHDVVRAPITAPAAGVYMVKIGNAKARKVVMLR